MKLLGYRAAIFDLDGTLVHSEPAWEEAKRRVLAQEGVVVGQEIYEAFVGRGLRGFLTEALGEGLTEPRRADLAARIGAEADVLLPQMRQPVAGAAEAVRHLARGGVCIAVCSSSPRRHIEAALAELAISEHVAVAVSGAELARGKPDPLPYLETLRHLGLAPDAAFAVEDALPGAISAHAAGLAVIAIGSAAAKPEFERYCRQRVADFEEFGRRFLGGAVA